MQHQIRVLIGFNHSPDHRLEEIAGAVFKGMSGNATFPNPPVSMADLQILLTALTKAIADQMQGGTAATAIKNDARAALINALRQLAGYVQANCNNSLSTVLSSGFEAVTSNHPQTILTKPVIVTVETGNTGQLLVKVKPVANAKCFEVRYATVTGGTVGEWQNGGLFTDSRMMPVNGLTAGTNYTIQVRAVGGSTGYSDWSNPSGHMCI